MGIDEGPSTVAAVSEDLAILEELAPKCKDYNKQIARLQRQIDASTRLKLLRCISIKINICK